MANANLMATENRCAAISIRLRAGSCIPAIAALMTVSIMAVASSTAGAEAPASDAPAESSSARTGGRPEPGSAPGTFPLFVNNSLAYVHGADFRTPFIANAAQPRGADIARGTLQFSHVDAWRLGHNLAQVMFRSSSSVEPAAGGGAGATEFYGVFRAGLSINRMADRSVIGFGPLRDIDIQAGADLQTKNSAYAPSERALYLGPRLLFHFYSGAFLNVGIHLRKEWNRNGILGRNESYDAGLNIEPAWSVPFRVGSARLVFDGFADYNAPKGRNAAGHETRAELLVRPQLKLDVGALLGLAPAVLEFGAGMEYWHNMFGQDARVVPGAEQSAPVFSLIFHWGGHRAPETDARNQLR